MKSLHEIKLEHIRRALIEYHGNKTFASRALRISLRSVRLWVAKEDKLIEFRKNKGGGKNGNYYRDD